MPMPSDVQVLGDPHLGRKFRTGVPLHRVGEREELVWNQFDMSLMHPKKGIKFHVNMGDTFDKFVVPPEVILRAAETYRAAAAMYPQIQFVVIQGNHDVSRDTTRRSSFDLFALLVAGCGNVHVIQKPKVLGEYGFVPYSAFDATADLTAQLPDNLKAVFGHWDIQDWGGDNVIPTKLLSEKGIKLAISGHDHLRRDEKRDGVEILVTGSMQPYSHAEDPTGQWYVSLPLEQIDPDAVRDKNVRVLLRQGETLPGELDCLSLTSRWMDAPDKIEIDTSDFETLDINQLLRHALDGLPILDEVMAKFEEIRE